MFLQRQTIQHNRKGDFPLLHNNPQLAYFDNASTTQKPESVIQAEVEYYRTMNANTHRGVYALAERATNAFEAVRQQVREFLHARLVEEIIFTKGTTESINLVASTWGKQNVQKGDVIILSEMEHHANIVPWQQLASSVGAELRWIPVTDEGRLDMKAYAALLDEKVKLVAVSAMSNVLGTINPVKELVKKAHAVGAAVLIDAAQLIAHSPVDVQSWDADFVAFSSHKMYGPTGVGVLYGKKTLLETIPPYQFGGDMILSVHKDGAEWNELPYKFEGGTQNLAGVIGLGAAIRFLQSMSWETIQGTELRMTDLLLRTLQSVPDVTIFGPKDLNERGSVVSFNIGSIHAHDLATVFDSENIAIRSGHHCAQPLMDRFNVPAMARVSLALYNTEEGIEKIPAAIAKAKKILT